MPHFILEYSSNLDGQLNVADLFKDLHDTAIDIGIFPTSGIRSRAVRCEEFRVAEGDPENAFVHLTTKIGVGRDIEIRKDTADRIFETLTGFLQPIFDKRYLSIGFELVELHPTLIYKKTNIEEKLKKLA